PPPNPPLLVAKPLPPFAAYWVPPPPPPPVVPFVPGLPPGAARPASFNPPMPPVFVTLVFPGPLTPPPPAPVPSVVPVFGMLFGSPPANAALPPPPSRDLGPE